MSDDEVIASGIVIPNNSEEVEEEDEDDEEDVGDEEEPAIEVSTAPQKKRGRPRKSPAKEVADVEPKKGSAKKVDDVVELAAKVKTRFEKLLSKNSKETNKTVKKGLNHSDGNVLVYYEQKLKNVVPKELYVSYESTTGLEDFEEKSARNKVIRNGLNAMVENCIAVVDLMIICTRDMFSKNLTIGLTLQIQLVMSKLKPTRIIELSSCLLNQCLILSFISIFHNVEKSDSPCG